MRRAALGLLARREHSYTELRRKLLAKTEFSAEQIDALLNELVAEGLLSDGRFAEVCIRSKTARGYGPKRIKETLKEKGVSPTVIDTHLNEQAEQWQAQLTAAWQKRFNGKKPQDYAEYVKQARFLQYRGFEPSQIKSFLDKISAL